MDELIEELPHLTERQFDAVVWVCRYWIVHRHGPTHREVTAGLGGSVVTATLVDKGYLERTAATSRNIRPTANTFEKLKHEGVILEPLKQGRHRARRGKTGA